MKSPRGVDILRNPLFAGICISCVTADFLVDMFRKNSTYQKHLLNIPYVDFNYLADLDFPDTEYFFMEPQFCALRLLSTEIFWSFPTTTSMFGMECIEAEFALYRCPTPSQSKSI